MQYKKSSWKDKLDPAFDKIIKTYLQFIDLVNLPSNTGWIIPEDAYYKKWELKGMQGWVDRYEKNISKTSEMVRKFKTQKNIPKKEKDNRRKSFQRNLFKQIAILPQNSQEYYKKAFEPFYSDNSNDDFKNMPIEELKERVADFFADQFLLIVHIRMVEIENEVESLSKQALQKKYSRPSIMIDIMLALFDTVSLLVFEQSLYSLIKDAKNGDEESFFKLLRIDRSIIECEWAKKMIRKAQFRADERFFKEMAKAITKSPLENDKEYSLAIIVLLLFWRLGMRKLENEEQIELLEECGIRVQENPETFRTFAYRLTRAELKKDIVTFSQDNPSPDSLPL